MEIGSVYQVAQGVCEVRIQTLYHQFPGDDAVVLERHFVEYKITHGVHAEEINQFIRIQHISLGFAHLTVALQQPRMPENLLRQRKIQTPSGISASISYGNG